LFNSGVTHCDAAVIVMKVRTLPVVEASGKPYAMGQSIGKKCRARAATYRKSIADTIERYTGVDWPKAVLRAKDYLPYAESFYPDFVEEIKGYAVGARLPFEDAFALCCHEMLSPLGMRGCTDVAVNGDVTEDGRVLAAHNEDWSSDAAETVVLLHGRPSGKPEFFTTSYAGLLPSSGMNSAGISITGNALDPNDVRTGVPKAFPVRKIVEAKRIGQALEFALPPDRASSYNNICSDKSGEIYSLEGSATDCGWIYAIDGYLVHTNHYVVPKMEKFEADRNSNTCSIFRYYRALRLLEDQLGSVTIESLKGIMRDHLNKPGSICRHPDPGLHRLDVSETIFSVIYDLTRREAHVLKGKPCVTEYAKFSLGAD
jgi:isopenicillin-N N-acyltransferase-like protein